MKHSEKMSKSILNTLYLKKQSQSCDRFHLMTNKSNSLKHILLQQAIS